GLLPRPTLVAAPCRDRAVVAVGRDPGHHLVVAPDVVHEAHRLPAARVAEARLAIPALLGQQRQALADVRPAVRVEAALLRDPAGTLEVAEADVVGRQAEPRAV